MPSQCCAAGTYIKFQSIFIITTENPILIKQSLNPFLSPWQPPVCFLSLWIYLFWIFPINGIIWYVTFCVWLLSLNILFSGFFYLIACIRTFFLLWLDNIPLYLPVCFMHLSAEKGLLPPFGYREPCCSNKYVYVQVWVSVWGFGRLFNRRGSSSLSFICFYLTESSGP